MFQVYPCQNFLEVKAFLITETILRHIIPPYYSLNNNNYKFQKTVPIIFLSPPSLLILKALTLGNPLLLFPQWIEKTIFLSLPQIQFFLPPPQYNGFRGQSIAGKENMTQERIYLPG